MKRKPTSVAPPANAAEVEAALRALVCYCRRCGKRWRRRGLKLPKRCPYCFQNNWWRKARPGRYRDAQGRGWTRGRRRAKKE